MTPDQILGLLYQQAQQGGMQSVMIASHIFEKIELVSMNIQNRAGVRLILACALAKVYDPSIDIRKPYTEIGDMDSYSGRAYDERYIAPFIIQYQLPCNPTTAFLTPALRNRNTVLTPDLNLSGRPREVYQACLELLNHVYQHDLTANDLLKEIIRQLIVLRDQKQQRMESLLANLQSNRMDRQISVEQIISLISQHLSTKGSSRLPVLLVMAAYLTVSPVLQEHPLPLEAHQSADSQTKSLGDVQITLINDERIITCYEMKHRRVTITDLDLAVQQKISAISYPLDNYVFITTDIIDPLVDSYAKKMFEMIGVEVTILDCIQFVRHFLYLFYRQRVVFLNMYQQLVLAEPDSAVSQPVKEVFLSLRHALESNSLE
ncbi:MAG: DNA methyltransferase [Phototrophicaceae bacterium]